AEVRQNAEKRLREVGEPALAPLRKAAKSHPDPDVRLRAIVLAGNIDKGIYGEMRRLTGHTNTIRSVAFSRDGKKALTGSMDKTMRLWDVETGKQLKKFEGHGSWVWTVAFHPDGKHALSAGSLDKTLRL